MKKIISFILMLAVVMSSFGAYAREYLPLYEDMDSVFRFDVGEFVETTETEDGVVTPDMKVMQLLETLGIWDDAEKGENEFITLTEFSIIMSRLRLGPQNALEGVYKLNESKENATYRNAYAYLLEALGYDYKCKEYQNSDEGLLIVASQIKLISEEPENIGAYITRGALARLIAKALTIDICIMEPTQNGGYRYTVAEGTNLLNSVHNIYEIEGFVNAIPGLSVYGGASLREGYIQIDRRNIKTNGLNLDKFLGSRVTAYAEFDEGSNTYSILYIDYAEDYQVLEIDFRDIVSLRNNTITYVNEENVEVDIEVNNLSHIIENGSALRSIDEMSDYETNEGKIVLTASVKNDDFDTAIIYKYNYYVSAYADTYRYRLGLDFKQTYNGLDYIQLGEKDIIKLTVDGVQTPFEQMPSGVSFRVFRCEDTGYTEIVALTKKITGSVEALYDSTVRINEVDYNLTRDIIKHIEYCKNEPSISYSQKVKELDVGSESTFYVFEDKIVCYTSAQEYKYGYLKSVGKDRSGIDPDLTFRILTQDGEWVDFKVTKAIEVDGEKKVSKEKLMTKINNNLDIINNIVRYKATGKNELTALDTVVENPLYESDVDGFTEDVHFECNFNFERNWTGDWISLSSSYFFSTDTIIFVAPVGETKEDKFRVVKSSQLPSGTLPMKFYSPDEYNQISVAVCTISFDQAGAGSDSEAAGPFYYVEGIRKTVINAEDDTYGYRIMAKKINPKDSMVHTERIGNIVDTSFVVAEDLLDKNFVTEGEYGYDYSKKIEIGDFIEATVTGGEATSWSMCLKGGVVGQLSEANDDIDDYKDRKTFDVYAKGKVVSINPATRIMVFESEGVKHPAYMNVTAVIDTSTNKIRLVSAADFRVGDIIYTYVRYGRMYFMVKNE